jgi:hypothetical protein
MPKMGLSICQSHVGLSQSWIGRETILRTQLLPHDDLVDVVEPGASVTRSLRLGQSQTAETFGGKFIIQKF